MRLDRSLLAPALLLAPLLAGSAGAQVFSQNTDDIPSGSPDNMSITESVDFGDVDLDGDWDAVWADGGDGGNDQNRIWINQGGLQAGTVGVFVDETAARFPVYNDDSHDMEFADIDGDGDLDLHTSNTCQITNQPDTWWVNAGGAQAGTLGAYTDETADRWVNLGVHGPGGSSVPAAYVLPGGGFIDWNSDCDFGDLDADGDLDLVHSSYGGAFAGQSPTRIFLNDGDGYFEEFNPGGHQLVSSGLTEGQPALWAEGVYAIGTTDTTGMEADVCTTALDLELGDTDGDFDLDLLLGDRMNLPRFFRNRLEENGGTLSFRDVSHAVFEDDPWAERAGHYEQELGDVDGDGDLDLFGLDWGGFTNSTFANDGTGFFYKQKTLPNSTSDENEVDCFDYDNDGVLDLYVADFSGGDSLYRNNGEGNDDFTFDDVTALSGLPETSPIAWDADAADVDNDGDYDIFVAHDGFQANWFLENVTQLPDTHAPYIPALEATSDRSATPQPIPVRAQVYDNAPYYITWYNPTVLEVSVNGCRLPDVPMTSSAGQIFRGLLPGNLIGQVSYTVRSSDEYGNTGTASTPVSYVSTTALDVGGTYGAGAPAGSEPEPGLVALSVAFPGTTLYVGMDGMNAGSIWAQAIGLARQDPPITAFPAYTPVIHVASVTLTLVGLADADGCGVTAFPLSAGVPSGASIWFQAFTSDSLDFAEPWAASAGLEVVLDP